MGFSVLPTVSTGTGTIGLRWCWTLCPGYDIILVAS